MGEQVKKELQLSKEAEDAVKKAQRAKRKEMMELLEQAREKVVEESAAAKITDKKMNKREGKWKAKLEERKAKNEKNWQQGKGKWKKAEGKTAKGEGKTWKEKKAEKEN